jgi:disulfide bond formation protein DsbB
MFGLSFAGWNVVASSILAVIALVGALAPALYADRLLEKVIKKNA